MSCPVPVAAVAAMLLVVATAHAAPWSVRVSGGGPVGRIEVQRAAGEPWGSVCSFSVGSTPPITLDTAAVVCSLAGFAGVAAVPFPSFPDGIGVVAMANLDCPASAGSLENCTFSEEEAYNCSHLQDVGVGCFTSEPRPSPPLYVTFSSTTAPTILTGFSKLFSIATPVAQILSLLEEADTPTWSTMGFNFTSDAANGAAPWMLASALQSVSASYLADYFQIFELATQSPPPEANVWKNPTTWKFRLNSATHADSVVTALAASSDFAGRMEVQPGPEAPWGTVCSDDISDDDAAALCNAVSGNPLSTVAWDVLPIPYYDDALGNGPTYLSAVECGDVPPISFASSCNEYVLSTPNDRGGSTCDHSKDLGIICQSSTYSSIYSTSNITFVAYFQDPICPCNVIDLMANNLRIPTERIAWSSAHDDARNLSVVTFTVLNPSAADLYRHSVAALNSYLLLMSPVGLLELYGIQWLTFSVAPTSSATPAPDASIALVGAGVTYSAVVLPSVSNEVLLTELAAFCTTRPFAFAIVSRARIPSSANLESVAFQVLGFLPPPEQLRIAGRLQSIVGNATAYRLLGFQTFATLSSGSSSDGFDDDSEGRMMFMIIAVILVLVGFIYVLARRSRWASAHSSSYSSMLQEGEGRAETGTRREPPQRSDTPPRGRSARVESPPQEDEVMMLPARGVISPATHPISAAAPSPGPEGQTDILTGRIVVNPTLDPEQLPQGTVVHVE